ncbi:hypothetical protein HII12_002220 [Brettanomyces bruxellensis]|uniref:Zn(2)-C6 fungal-type domain-containing protein n=1 Tax=Dekkera bruxellensis TaxID=5007 RepID=A0A8H6EW69_DEKBR|nr:hypothetical protein HII12_002220 [Brettanomyces bruxellensis]
MTEVASLKRKQIAQKRNRKRRISSTPLSKRRVRTGCLTCRSKHKKCDENKPVCNFCAEKGYDCVWKGGSQKLDLAKSTLSDFLSLQNCTRNLASMLNYPIATTIAFGPTDSIGTSRRTVGLTKTDSTESVCSNSEEPLVLSSYLHSNVPLYTSQMSRNSTSCFGNIEQNNASFNFITPRMFQQESDLSHFKIPPRFFSLPKTLSSILSVYLSVHGKHVGAQLPNDEYTFEIFTDRSSAKMDKLKFYDNIKQYPFLFDVFKGEISPMLSSLGDQVCIFRDVIPKLSIHFPALHYAILTLSSRLLEENTQDYSGKNTITFYNSSLRELGLILKEGVSLEAPIRSKLILATILFLELFESLSLYPEDLDHRFDVYGIFVNRICTMWKDDLTVKALTVNCLLVQLIISSFQKVCHINRDLFSVNIASPYYKLLCLNLELETEAFEDVTAVQNIKNKLNRLKNELPQKFQERIEGQSFFVNSEELACSELYLITLIGIKTKILQFDANMSSEYEENIEKMAARHMHHDKNEDINESIKKKVPERINDMRRNLDQLLAVLHRNMGWKNIHSMSCLMVTLYCIKKILDNSELTDDQKAPFSEVANRIADWSGLSRFRSL